MEKKGKAHVAFLEPQSSGPFRVAVRQASPGLLPTEARKALLKQHQSCPDVAGSALGRKWKPGGPPV